MKRTLTASLATIGTALLMLCSIALASDTHAVYGGSYATAGGSFQYTHDPEGPCHQFVNGEWFSFGDLHANINPLVTGIAHYEVWFTIDLYEWVNGARGNWIDGDNDYLGPTDPGDNTLTNTQTVTGQYTNWNGSPSCWTFEVYRTWWDNQAGSGWDQVVY